MWHKTHVLVVGLGWGEDVHLVFWIVEEDGDFDICLYYNELRGSFSVIFPWEGIWKVKAPQWVSFFIWTAVWDKILIGDNLRRRGFDFVDWYVMCRCYGEIMDHLLLHWEKVHQLWSFAFKSFGVSWFLPRMVLDILFDWWNWLGKHSSSIWNLVPLCLMWCIWKEHNQQTLRTCMDRVTSCLLFLVVLC